MCERKITMGMAVSPRTGNKVLAVQKNTSETINFMRSVKDIDGNDDSGYVKFQGEKGEVLNYVTLELYGKVGLISELLPEGIRPISEIIEELEND